MHDHEGFAEIDTTPGAAAKVLVRYTNWRGETRTREIIPRRIEWGSNEYHLEPQWLIHAECVESRRLKTFALKNCDFRVT